MNVNDPQNKKRSEFEFSKINTRYSLIELDAEKNVVGILIMSQDLSLA